MINRCTSFPHDLYIAQGPCQMRCQNASKGEDKEYQVAILYDRQKTGYTVYAAWGRWGETLDGQVKGMMNTEQDAVQMANEWVQRKNNRGYKEVALLATSVPGEPFNSIDLMSAAANIQRNPHSQPKKPAIRNGGTWQAYQKRTKSPVVHPVSYDADKWRDFLRTTGTEKEKIQDYYFSKTPKKLSTTDYDWLIRELFMDVAETGGFQLPKHVKKEDFTFQFVTRRSNIGATGNSGLADTLTVEYKPSAETRSIHCSPQNLLNPDRTLDDFLLGQTLQMIGNKCISVMQLQDTA